jgi:HlyD family secretion protein
MRMLTAHPGVAAFLLTFSITAIGCGGEEDGRLAASGTIETIDITVSPLVSGPIVRLPAREGASVHRGETLAVIDASDLELQRAQLLAALDITRAQYEQLRNGPRSEDIAQAVAMERQAQATLDMAIDDLRRLEGSYAAGGIAEKAVADARKRVEVARQAHQSARLAVDRLRQGSRREELRAGSAREAQAAAQLEALEKKIDDCVVRAPADGVLTTVGVDEGEFAAAGGALMTISRTSDVELTVYVAEKDLGRVRLGQRADLTVDAYEGRHFNGRVTYISPEAEFTPKNVQTKDDRVKQVFEVRISAPNPDGALKAGLTADARLL